MAQEQAVKVVYRKLRERLDRMPIGAPPAGEMYEILKMLFTEEEAAIGAMMPQKPSPLGEIARRTGVAPARLLTVLENMAGDGLVLDMRDPSGGDTLYLLAPTVVGFFEFSLMKKRDDIDQAKLAALYQKYMFEHKIFAHDAFNAKTQFGRTIVHESALTPEQLGGVMSHERAGHIVDSATRYGIAPCYCRNKAALTGHTCHVPLEMCLSFDTGADYLTRHGLARKSSKSEVLEILAQARELGLVHMTENVQNNPSMICNCCGCHCGVLSAINIHGINHAMMSSNFIASIDTSACKGCGKCAERCPIGAIEIKEYTNSEGKPRKRAHVDEAMCLGCGVCHASCKFGALSMASRPERVFTPENMLGCMISMALERGKIGNLIFDDLNRSDHRFLRRFTAAVMDLPLTKQIMLNDTLKSRFIDFVIKNVPGAKG